MKNQKLLKGGLFVGLLIVVLWALQTWYFAFVPGRSWEHNAFYITVAVFMVPIVVLILAYRAVKWIKNISLVLVGLVSVMFMQSCNYAKTNQIVVYSDDCGVTWQQVKSGEKVPTGVGNRCFLVERMPGYAMQGDMEYYVLFKDQVKVKMLASYDYEIVDPLLFMQEAKTLGKTNESADEGADSSERFEGAENRVIDVRLKKITSDQFAQEDVVSHDINLLEEKYLELVNGELKKRGVKLTILELVPIFQPQTQLAIDAANADRIYKAKGMQEYGRKIALAKAGATQIVINNSSAEKNDHEDVE